MSFALVVVTLATLLAWFTSASSGRTLAAGGFSDSLHLIDFTNADYYHPLDARQLGPVPTQCDSICNPVTASLGANCTAVQCCTDSFEEQVFQCFTCLEDGLGETNFTQPQSTIDAFYNACTALGFSLPILTFPGQSVNRPLSSLLTSASPTDTLSLSQSATLSQSTTLSQFTISQTTDTATLVNPFATISQTAITSLPSPSTTQPSTTTTSPSTSPSITHVINSGRRIEGRIQLPIWIPAMGTLILVF